MAEGVLGLELVLGSQQHGEVGSPGAGGTLGPCWGTQRVKQSPIANTAMPS